MPKITMGLLVAQDYWTHCGWRRIIISETTIKYGNGCFAFIVKEQLNGGFAGVMRSIAINIRSIAFGHCLPKMNAKNIFKNTYSIIRRPAGLVVWYSLWVRVVPGSIPGSAPFLTSSAWNAVCDTKNWLLKTQRSSVGRATDCRSLWKLSVGRWFDSGRWDKARVAQLDRAPAF